jgi:hypothetical protein
MLAQPYVYLVVPFRDAMPVRTVEKRLPARVRMERLNARRIDQRPVHDEDAGSRHDAARRAEQHGMRPRRGVADDDSGQDVAALPQPPAQLDRVVEMMPDIAFGRASGYDLAVQIQDISAVGRYVRDKRGRIARHLELPPKIRRAIRALRPMRRLRHPSARPDPVRLALKRFVVLRLQASPSLNFLAISCAYSPKNTTARHF